MSITDSNASFVDRVRFSELDPQGVVFYSRYFEYADAAIIGYFRNNGVSAAAEPRYDFQIKTCSAEFFRPLKMDDEYCTFVSVKKLGTSSALFLVSICESCTKEQCCVLEVLQVYVNLEAMSSTPIPDSLRAVLRSS